MRAGALFALALALALPAQVRAAVRPADFVARVDNPWFPLVPGTVRTYRGTTDGRPSRDVVTVTHGTRVIVGVRTTAVRDLVYVDGRLRERTTDWYAQDRSGNVWYFGEDTAELDSAGRVVTREGTWLAGVDGAEPGILMPGRPTVGRTGRQEYLPGHAEDHFRIAALGVKVSTPAITSAHALATDEWTPLEPGVLERKVYVRGVGSVLEETVKGGTERIALVSIRRP
jgi:hypothetical protein